MKDLATYSLVLALGLGVFSCSKEEDSNPTTSPTQGYSLMIVDQSESLQLELYHHESQIKVGFNEFLVRIKELNGNYREVDSLWWKPIMHMSSMQHSCPFELPLELRDNTYKGSMIFQMASNGTEYWELTLGYVLDGKTYEHNFVIEVFQTPNERKNISVFSGNDGVKYVLALMPFTPEVKTQNIKAKLFKMVNMMEFSAMPNFSIDLDPRMPSMGNHGSPNNQPFTYNEELGEYKGLLSLTMTGYWRLNLVLRNPEGAVVKGEYLDDNKTESSLYWEVEF